MLFAAFEVMLLSRSPHLALSRPRLAPIGLCVLALGCAGPVPRATATKTRAQQVRILTGIYDLPSGFHVRVTEDEPGFKKLKYVNSETRCSGVWLFNILGLRGGHERYVAETIERPLSQNVSGRASRPRRTEDLLRVFERDARAVRFAFKERGTPFESGFLEVYDDAQKLSVVLLSDCLGGTLADEQRLLVKVLATALNTER